MVYCISLGSASLHRPVSWTFRAGPEISLSRKTPAAYILNVWYRREAKIYQTSALAEPQYVVQKLPTAAGGKSWYLAPTSAFQRLPVKCIHLYLLPVNSVSKFFLVYTKIC